MRSRVRGAKAPRELTERQRYWLEHIRTAEGGAEPLKHYAARQGLSEHSLYEAKRQLREAGVLAPAAAGRKSTKRFTRVAVVEAAAARPASLLRVRLASGAELEWSEAPRGEVLRELLGILAG